MLIVQDLAAEYRFFWNWELEHFPSEAAARKFISGLKDSSAAMAAVRDLLNPREAEDGDDTLFDVAARLLANGQVIAGITTHRPFNPMWRCRELFRDGYLALNFLARFRNGPIAVAGLRGIAGQANPGASLPLLTIDEVLLEIGHLLSSGRLVVGYRLRLRGGGDDSSEPRKDALASSSTATRTITEAASSDDGPTLPDNDGVLQARALQNCSKTGTPFCEECAKAAAARSGNV